jgi:hypothetical protein
MAINQKTDQLVHDYVRRALPSLEASMKQYLSDELQNIERSLGSIGDASIQVADAPPANARKGMVRYAVSPWNPLGNSATGLMVYNGSAWVAV